MRLGTHLKMYCLTWFCTVFLHLYAKKNHKQSTFINEAKKLYQKEFIKWFKLTAEINLVLKWFYKRVELNIPHFMSWVKRIICFTFSQESGREPAMSSQLFVIKTLVLSTWNSQLYLLVLFYNL
jgi:hypothetical protein